jgi:flavodoxin
MNSLVIYGSRYGNTRRVAEAIAGELGKHGEAQLVSAEEAASALSEQTDLLVIGGPTEAHGMTEPLAHFFVRLEEDALLGKAAAAFDTRLRMPAWLSGSAGAAIERRLRHAGARVIAHEASFFVGGKPSMLQPGEIEQATVWAASLASKVESREPVLTGR